MIHIGTSGFSYDDWIGHFYPEGTRKPDMLRYYAQHFRAVEVNYTYYRMPTATTLGQMAAKTPAGFQFVIKANSLMTHERETEPAIYEQFCSALEPLIESGKFGCILAQFPYSFRPSPRSAEYIGFLREQIPELPMVVEFRNRGWARRETLDILTEHNLGYCCVDEPNLRGLMPRAAAAVSDIGYVRFHGRNAEQWWDHEEAWQRYDYMYSEDELREWVEKVQGIEKKTYRTYVFFNNHYQGKAAMNASLFDQLLGGTST